MNLYKALFLSIVLLFVGCGGGGGGGTAQTQESSSQPVGVASLVVKQSIAPRAVPSSVDNVRITGFKLGIIQGVLNPTGGGETFAARTFPLATTYRIDSIPANTTAIQIEYLDAGKVVGLYVEDGLTLVDGQVYEIDDPAITLAPEINDFKLRATLFSPSGIGYFPPGEGVSIPIADYPFQSGSAVPLPVDYPDLETFLFDLTAQLPNTDALLAFTYFTSSDPSVIEPSNSGLFNSAYRSGSLWGKKPGEAVITANFLGMERSVTVKVANIRESEPTVYVFQNPGYPREEYATVTRIHALGNHVDPVAGIFETEVDYTSELYYRPSDKPNVARWDDQPGREGYIIRGNEAGRVILWARHPNNPLNWLAYPVENLNP